MERQTVRIVKATSTSKHGLTIAQLADYITNAHANDVDPDSRIKVNITWSGGIKTIENKP